MMLSETLREEKAKLEVAIVIATSKAVADFKATTGLTPSSIDVRMVGLSQLGSEPEYMVGAVRASVEI